MVLRTVGCISSNLLTRSLYVVTTIVYSTESECMLTPEHSIQIQNAIGADIIMQLDDVVKSTITGPRVEEAMHR